MVLNLIPQAYASCSPGTDEAFNLGDCVQLGDGRSVNQVEAYSTPAGLFNLIVPNLFIIGGIILFFLLLFAGFKFISGGTKGKDEAQQMLTTAVAGFLLMFAAYWIVQIIKVVTGADINL